MASPTEYEKIRTKVRQIPKGSVATYGQIAAMAGLPRHARLVGYVLRHTPEYITLPWHRVVNAKGESAFPHDSEPYTLQKKRLAGEGVVMIAGRVPLDKFRWQESLDELLWKP